MGGNTDRWTWQHVSLIVAGGVLFVGLLCTDKNVLERKQTLAGVDNAGQSHLAATAKDSIINFIPTFNPLPEQAPVFKGLTQKWTQYTQISSGDQIKLIQEFAAFFVGSQRIDLAALLQEKLWVEHHLELPKLTQRFIEAYQDSIVSQDSSVFRYFNSHAIEYAGRAADAAQEPEKYNLLVAKYIAMAKSGDMNITMQGILNLANFADKHPENFTANLELAIFAYQTNQYEKALIRATRAVQADDNQAIAYFWFGKIHYALGHSEQAKDAWQKAKTRNPSPSLLKQINQQLQNI